MRNFAFECEQNLNGPLRYRNGDYRVICNIEDEKITVPGSGQATVGVSKKDKTEQYKLLSFCSNICGVK